MIVGVVLLDMPRYRDDEKRCSPGDAGLDDRPVGFMSNPSSWRADTHYLVARGWPPEASESADERGARALRAAMEALDGRVDVITTNCAYSWFTRDALRGLGTPVMLSGLALLGLAREMAGDVAVVVSHGPTVRRLLGEPPAGVRIVELDGRTEWARFHDGDDVSQTRMAAELVGRLREDLHDNGRPGACVLECSGLPQFHAFARDVYGCPVLDVGTAVHTLLEIPPPRWQSFAT